MKANKKATVHVAAAAQQCFQSGWRDEMYSNMRIESWGSNL